MPPSTRDNDDERLARIAMILEDVRLGTEHLHILAIQAKARAVTRRRAARALVHEEREARADRAEKKR
jgi:hypothetical protein